jgi:hypothetical protein
VVATLLVGNAYVGVELELMMALGMTGTGAAFIKI